MKSFTRLSACLVLAVSALLAAGCPKRPLRPNPSQTMIGGGGTDTLSPLGTGFESDLQSRPTGSSIDDANFNELQPVLFDFDSAAIRASERSKVEQAASYLKANPGARLVLVGRCDWRGTTEYNMGLGDRRGRSVKDFLATFGVSASSVEVISKGDLDAKEGGNTADMQQDRRVDIGVLK
jgi:peptidoglycan-associated lipoprotein